MIYIIGNTILNYFKIGYTYNEETLKKRLSSYNTYLPFNFDFIKTFKGGYKTEKKIHKYFINNKIKGEWFYLINRLNEIDFCYDYCYQKDDEIIIIERIEEEELPF